MILELTPGATVMLGQQRYTVEETATFHDEDFRLDLVHLAGATPAHERWLLATLPEPYLMLLQRLEQDWLAPPQTSIAHDGELFVSLYRGSGYRLRRWRAGKSKEGRTDYALFRADSGRVILTIGQNTEFDAWIGVTLPPDAVQLPRGSAK